MSLPDWISMSVCLSPCMKPAKMSRLDIRMWHALVADTAKANETAKRTKRKLFNLQLQNYLDSFWIVIAKLHKFIPATAQ